jgi:hypothetical protein
MKWIGGISFSSRVTGMVVIAVTAFILCQCLTIESSAQTASAAFRNMKTERVRLRDPTPESIGRQAGRIDGGILNLDVAFIVALREAQMDEVRTSEPGLSAASASPPDADSGEGEEKSRLKAPSDDPQDWRLEDKISSRVVRLLVRTFLNPTRSFANLLRAQGPWYRDNRQ